MKRSFKIITEKSGLAVIAAIAALGVASPASAQSYSFPTYAYMHPATGLGSSAHAPALDAHLYDAASRTNTPWTADPNTWGSAAARGSSH